MTGAESTENVLTAAMPRLISVSASSVPFLGGVRAAPDTGIRIALSGSKRGDLTVPTAAAPQKATAFSLRFF